MDYNASQANSMFSENSCFFDYLRKVGNIYDYLIKECNLLKFYNKDKISVEFLSVILSDKKFTKTLNDNQMRKLMSMFEEASNVFEFDKAPVVANY